MGLGSGGLPVANIQGSHSTEPLAEQGEGLGEARWGRRNKQLALGHHATSQRLPSGCSLESPSEDGTGGGEKAVREIDRKFLLSTL